MVSISPGRLELVIIAASKQLQLQSTNTSLIETILNYPRYSTITRFYKDEYETTNAFRTPGFSICRVCSCLDVHKSIQ